MNAIGPGRIATPMTERFSAANPEFARGSAGWSRRCRSDESVGQRRLQRQSCFSPPSGQPSSTELRVCSLNTLPRDFLGAARRGL